MPDSFTFTGSYDAQADRWSFSPNVPAGSTVNGGDIAHILLLAAAHYSAHRHERHPTEPEVAAMLAACALPDGWAATNDGVNTYTTLGEGGGTRYTRWYERDGERIEAPCDAAGNPIPATRAALLAALTGPPTPEA